MEFAGKQGLGKNSQEMAEISPKKRGKTILYRTTGHGNEE